MAILLDMTRVARTRARRRADRPDPARRGRDGGRLHLRRGRPRAPRGRADRRLGHARLHRPRPGGRGALRGVRARGGLPDALPAHGLRRGARAARARRGSRPTSSISTSASPRCRWTRASAASPTPTTRRSTCAWTPRQELDARAIVNGWDERQLAQLFRRYGEDPNARRIAREIVRRRGAGADRDHRRAGGGDRGRAAGRGAAQLRRRPSRQARLPGGADRGQRGARLARPRAAARLGAAARGRAASRRSRSTRSRTGASSASSPSGRAAASARPTSPSACAGASPRRSCSPVARWRPPPGEVADNPRAKSGPPARRPQARRGGRP